MDLRHSPLHDRHLQLGAKFAEFGEWEMPLEYAGGGVLAEHTSVREDVGLFDVSHLGKAVVRGTGAVEFVNSCLTNDLAKIGPGQAQYTLCCDDNGGTVDDLIAYVRSEFEVLLIPNAANAADVIRRLTAAAGDGVEVIDQHRALAVLALQGPRSDDVLGELGLDVVVDYMAFVETQLDGMDLTVCRTGYTGERGYEILVAADDAPQVWDRALLVGEAFGIRPAGLGARDTLRTEMGYPLHGHELSDQISPVMARATWAVGWSKPTFWGKRALERHKADPSVRTVRGLKSAGRAIARPGMVVSAPGSDGERVEVGQVTSGTFSPSLRQGIALALLEPDIANGATVSVNIRGREAEFVVTNPPFVSPST